MSREIKFRAWSKEYEEMFFLDAVKQRYDFEMGLVLAFPQDQYPDFNGHEKYSDDAEFDVMQFTGLTTSKGKEVYEGDIFRSEEENDFGDTLRYSVVMWIRQRAAFYLVPVEHYHILLDNDVSGEEEFSWLFQDAALYDFNIDIELPLVGNIHQNPELLK